MSCTPRPSAWPRAAAPLGHSPRRRNSPSGINAGGQAAAAGEPAFATRLADGKWSLAGRTGGPVIVLLNEPSGVPVDISITPRAAGLLDAPTSAADRAQRT